MLFKTQKFCLFNRNKNKQTQLKAELAKEKAEQNIPIGEPVESSGIEPTIFDLPLDNAEGDLSLSTPESPNEQDRWVVKGDYLIRIHKTPRKILFVPSEAKDPPPIPVSEIDVVRVTTTDLENHDEKRIEYFWDGSSPEDHRQLVLSAYLHHNRRGTIYHLDAELAHRRRLDLKTYGQKLGQ